MAPTWHVASSQVPWHHEGLISFQSEQKIITNLVKQNVATVLDLHLQDKNIETDQFACTPHPLFISPFNHY